MRKCYLYVVISLILAACGRPGTSEVPAAPPGPDAGHSSHGALSVTESVLYGFGYSDGAYPYGGALTFDASGNLYGTTEYGGPTNNGEVYELTPASTGRWKITVLHRFSGKPDGAAPYAGVVFGDANHIYGTTNQGGVGCADYGCGTVYELVRTGSTWNEQILYRFRDKPDGAAPWSGVTLDSRGDIRNDDVRRELPRQ